MTREQRLAAAGAALAAAALAAAPVGAHTLSESHSTWQVDGAAIHLQMIVPDVEARRLSGGAGPASGDELGRYLAARVGASAGGRDCPAVGGPRRLSATAGFFREEFVFQCPDSKELSIRSEAFFDLVPSHTNFARISDTEGRFFEQLFTKEHPRIAVSGAESESRLQSAGFAVFVAMGVMHIFTGADHMSFMLGLVLLSRRMRDLLFVVTGFTLGHSLTLALAVTGVLRPDPRCIDALVALTIALIGAENIGDSTHRPLPVALGLGGVLLLLACAKICGLAVFLPTTLLIGGALFAAGYLMFTGHLRDAGRARLLVTLVFGLIHGFGFASNLLEMRLPRDRVAELLLGFNLGVEIGQVTVVLGALSIAWAFGRLRLGVPRPLFADVAAAFLVGEGLYWFLGRSVVVG